MANYPSVSAKYHKQIKKARELLTRILREDNGILPVKMLQLAWNDAGTYDVNKHTGGANGSIRHWQLPKAIQLSENANLSNIVKALQICEGVKKENQKISFADIIQLAGVIAVEVLGGPLIKFVPGRKDAIAAEEDKQYPNACKDVLQKLEPQNQMGLSDKELVAVSGGLSLAKPYTFSDMTLKPMKFSNFFYKNILEKESENQYIHDADKAKLSSANFRWYIELYAKDEDVFITDYAIVHKKFSELGFVKTILPVNRSALCRSRAVDAVSDHRQLSNISNKKKKNKLRKELRDEKMGGKSLKWDDLEFADEE